VQHAPRGAVTPRTPQDVAVLLSDRPSHSKDNPTGKIGKAEDDETTELGADRNQYTYYMLLGVLCSPYEAPTITQEAVMLTRLYNAANIPTMNFYRIRFAYSDKSKSG
jgi:hypothetical protein